MKTALFEKFGRKFRSQNFCKSFHFNKLFKSQIGCQFFTFILAGNLTGFHCGGTIINQRYVLTGKILSVSTQ